MTCWKMGCHFTTMCLFVFILLCRICFSGAGSNNSAIATDTFDPTSSGRSEDISIFSLNANNNLSLPTTTVTDYRIFTKPDRLKPTSRTKLWSPHSSLVGDESEEEDNVTPHPSAFSSGNLTLKGTSREVVEHSELGPDPSSKASPKLPVISSIRHYRSRKSFVRTRKIDSAQQSVLNSQTVVPPDFEEEREQADEPQSHLPVSHASRESATRNPYGIRVLQSSRSSERKNGISVQNDGERPVYGIPYFIPPAEQEINTSKPQNSDKFLLRKFAQNPNQNVTSSGNITGSGNYSQKTGLKGKVGERGYYGVPISQRPGSDPHASHGKDSSKQSQDEATSVDLSQQPKRTKGRRKSQEKAGTKKGKYVDKGGNVPEEISSIQPTSTSVSPVRGTRPERKLNSGAFRRVQEKQKLASRQPDYADKRDFKPKSTTAYANQDAPAAQENGKELETFPANLSSEGLEPDEVEYFPKVEGEGNQEMRGNHLPDKEEEAVASESLYPEGDEYESLDPFVTSSPSPSSSNPNPGSDIVTVFLKIVESQHSLGNNCTRGTEFNLGDGVVDRYAQERFRLEAELTVNRANMLTRFWKYASRKALYDEYLLHAMIISLVEFDEDIFAGGNCYDENQYKNYSLFCPYGYRAQDGSILVKDLSLEYPYLSNTSEWFYKARKDAERIIKNYSQFSRGSHNFRKNDSTGFVEEEILSVTYEDGKWSRPYFDCGGGNIWMITYTIPFFGYNNGTYHFKGTSGIDIDLRRVDIDQCPLPANSTELNIFQSSDKCKNRTTKCVALKGLGFRRGSYKCECKRGFYFPDVTSPFKFFNGTLLEEEYEKKFSGTNESSLYDVDGMFECLECPFGCDTCVDDRPCVVSLNWLMRTGILILQGAIILMLPIVGLFTWKYSNIKVVRAASPVLLRFIVLGAFFIYCTILVMYPSPNIITCTLRVWLREIGFSLAYGALMLKTWRISVIFRVRSAKAIKITDMDLMKRLGVLVGGCAILLVIRTLVAPPTAKVSYTADELKAWLCQSDWWDHSFTFLELIFLVWGIRLCIVVRKAPSEFNESKFISLAIYNEFLLSLFLNISMLFLQSPANPDLLYIIFFCHVQLTMTLLLCLIFGSKAYIVFRGQGKGGGSDEARVPTSKFISKNRSGQTVKASSHNSIGLQSSNTSTSHDPNANSRLSEDVQEEFRRLYVQLEELKERNMRLGNRHLVAKIVAMQEAADNILCTTAQINGQQTGSGVSPSAKGKSGVLSDISEEENPSQPQSTVQTPKPKEKDTVEDGDGLRSGYEDRSTSLDSKLQEDGQLENLSNECHGEKPGGTGGLKTLELQDTNLDEVESEEEKLEDCNASDSQPECINEGDASKVDAESIPMQTIRKRKHKTETGGSSDQGGQPKGERSQNHRTKGSSKLVLDLDDKSRFTEEITV